MVSALFLDSVSTVLLMTPVVIRISEVTNLNPVPVLTIMILAVNIGSTASPVGNPPNVMIINHPFIKEAVNHSSNGHCKQLNSILNFRALDF